MKLDIDSIIAAGIVVVVMFLSMRLLYGCWPWDGRKIRRALRKVAPPFVEPPLQGPDFQPIKQDNEGMPEHGPVVRE